MAIIQNKATEIGDIILIKTEVPIIGLLALQDFYDSTQGETGSKYFERKFRYSIDGINWSIWIELTIPNIQNISVQPTDTFYVEYHYKRIGTDPSGDISFEDNTLVADLTTPKCGKVYDNSLFAQFFTCYDPKVLDWCLNVLEKMYKPGIIPNYIERGKRGNFNRQDEDFLTFWKTVACFFSVIVNYIRLFENYHLNLNILKEFLKAEGLFFCNESELLDLMNLMENYYSVISERGTHKIYKKKSEGNIINGELLRLICWKEQEHEFLFSLTKKEKIGWNINNSSPLYKGIYFDEMLIKGFEKTKDFINLDNYYIKNPTKCSIKTYGGKEVLEIASVEVGEKAGILVNNVELDSDKFMVINPGLAYEITFWVEREGLVGIMGTHEKITFGVNTYNKDNNYITGGVRSINPSTGITDYFFNSLLIPKDHIWYFVRGIIYPFGASYLPPSRAKTNLREGYNLKFNNINVVKIAPFIYLDNSGESEGSGVVRFWDVKVRPLKTDYETGFLQNNNFLKIWLYPNNLLYSQIQIDEIIREFMIPYNSTFKNTFLSKVGD